MREDRGIVRPLLAAVSGVAGSLPAAASVLFDTARTGVNGARAAVMVARLWGRRSG